MLAGQQHSHNEYHGRKFEAFGFPSNNSFVTAAVFPNPPDEASLF